MNKYKENLEEELKSLQNYKTGNKYVLIVVYMRIIDILKELKRMEDEQ